MVVKMGPSYFWILKTDVWLDNYTKQIFDLWPIQSKSDWPRTFTTIGEKIGSADRAVRLCFRPGQSEKSMRELETLVAAYSHTVSPMPTSLQIFAPHSWQHLPRVFTPFTTKQCHPFTYRSSSPYLTKSSLTKSANTDGLTLNRSSTTAHTLP